MTPTVLLVEIDVVSPAGATSTLRFADRAMRPFPAGAPAKANLVWDDRIIETPSFRASLFDDVTTLQPGIGAGMLTLANADHALDAYQGHAWGAVSIWRWTPGTLFSAAVVMLKGLASQPTFDPPSSAAARVRVPMFDYRAELETPIQGITYAGTNGVGGVLYEGEADGLKGKPKPVAFGDLTDAHLPAPQVNAGARVHQFHDGPIQGAEVIFDGGVDAGYADVGDLSGAAFDAATPGAASYQTDIGRGLVKINGAPVLSLTFGCKGDKSGGTYVETPGPVIAKLLAKAGVPGGRIGASVAALASAAVVGVFAAEPVNALDLVTFAGRAGMAAVLPDRAGVWQAFEFGPPEVVADFAITAGQVINLKPDEEPPPIGEFRVGWGRIWTTFSRAEIKASIKDTSAETRLASAYRYATLEDATVKARFTKAVWATATLDTALRQEADAIALAVKLKALLGLRADGSPRRMWRVTIENTDAAMAIAMGQTVSLDYPPAGLSGNFLLIGQELMRPRRDQAIWTVWG